MVLESAGYACMILRGRRNGEPWDPRARAVPWQRQQADKSDQSQKSPPSSLLGDSLWILFCRGLTPARQGGGMPRLLRSLFAALREAGPPGVHQQRQRRGRRRSSAGKVAWQRQGKIQAARGSWQRCRAPWRPAAKAKKKPCAEDGDDARRPGLQEKLARLRRRLLGTGRKRRLWMWRKTRTWLQRNRS